jgi:hypothetical protein
VDEIAHPYVSWGRWVAACPRSGCPNAEHFGADPFTQHVGGLAEASFRCAHCTLECAVQWPPERQAISALLNARTVPATRNWQVGESVEALLAENIEHGLLSATGRHP